MRRAVGALAVALVLAAGLAACGNGSGQDDGATAAGDTSLAPASTAAPGGGGTAPASATGTPAAGGSAPTTPTSTGVTASSAGGAALDTVPEADVAEMERTLDEIDQVLNDLDSDFNQDQ